MTGPEAATLVKPPQTDFTAEEGQNRVVPPKTLAKPEDRARQRKIGPLGYSHIAIEARDVQATRDFYENVIGLPLIMTVQGKQIRHPSVADPFDMVHFFFELADGTAIGFFGLEEGKVKPPLVLPNHNMQFHFALQMESEEAVHQAAVRVQEAGYHCGIRDHGDALSLYIDDPDGMQLELCYHRPTWFAEIDVEDAGSKLDEWSANGGSWK